MRNLPRRQQKYILASVLCVAYMVIAFFGLSHATHIAHSVRQMAGCPFMQGNPSFCDMHLFEHIRLWQKATGEAIFPSLIFLLLFFVQYSYIISAQKPIKKHRNCLKNHDPPHFLFTLLFSKGILNPKVP